MPTVREPFSVERAWDAAAAVAKGWWRHFVVLLSIGAALIAPLLWSRAVEFGHVLTYVLPILITFLAANWYLAVADIFFAVAASAPTRWWTKRPRFLPVRQFFAFSSRQFQYVDAILPWIVVAAIVPWGLPGIVGATAAAILLSSRFWHFVAAIIPNGGRHVDPYWRRRPVQIFWGVGGNVLLLVLVPSQGGELTRLFFLIWAAAAVRLLHWFLVDRALKRPDHSLTDAVHREENEGVRRRETLWAARLDWVGGVGALLLVGNHLAHPVIANLHVRDRECRRLVANACAPPSPSVATPLRLFVISDSQFHELRGGRSGASLDLVDAVVPVAVRPVELDLLEEATLTAFSEVYQTLRTEDPTLKWVHLGDFGDLGCQSELERFQTSVLPRFGLDHLAALVPGNHDSSFLGNFAWHPAWDEACKRANGKGQRMTKDESDKLLLAMMTDPTAAKSASEHQLIVHGKGSVFGTGRTALITVTPLGAVGVTTVVGAFIDTADYVGWTSLGASGVQGSVSKAQLAELQRRLDDVARAQTGKVAVVFFLHHPFESLDLASQVDLRGLAESRHYQVVALVSAHTHLAAMRSHRLGSRVIPEFVVGSTIDPPQEAALLEISASTDGGLQLALRTIQAVQRTGQSCAARSPYQADQCRDMVSHLKENDSCRPLFADQWLARQNDGGAHPSTPVEAKAEQQSRAKRLLTCICRDQRCKLGDLAEPLDDETLYEELSHLLAAPANPTEGERDATRQTRLELVCLSWAASIMQAKKTEQWDFNRALRDGYDGAATFGAIELLSSTNRCLADP